MNYSDIINDIKKLLGMKLQSVRPGADITLLEIDEAKECLLLETKNGQIRSRPLSEIYTIWDELSKSPAVHVEGVLHGSGTSRNQPETILANLPYIEWLKIDNKKHITYVSKKTHPYGTLKQVDPIESAILNDKINKTKTQKADVIVITKDITEAIEALQTTISGFVTALDKGVYSFDTKTTRFIIVLCGMTSLRIGTYPVIESSNIHSINPIKINDTEYHLIDDFGLNVLIKSN